MPILVLVYLGIRAFGPIFGQCQQKSIFFYGVLLFKGTLHRENVIFAGGGVLNPAKVSKIFTSTSCKRTMKIRFFAHQYQNVHDRNEDENEEGENLDLQRASPPPSLLKASPCSIVSGRGQFLFSAMMIMIMIMVMMIMMWMMMMIGS